MTPLLHWIMQHGYAGLFSLLVLGIVGLPVPDEVLLAFAGSQVYCGTFRFGPTLATALMGSVCGITISYGLGRTFGLYLIQRFGAWVHLTPDSLAQLQRWFELRGKWGLILGYFVPGVRHLMAYMAGMSALPLTVFALFAYTGGLLWSVTFITLGYAMGEEWQAFSAVLHQHLLLVSGVVLMGLLGYGIFIGIRRHNRG